MTDPLEHPLQQLQDNELAATTDAPDPEFARRLRTRVDAIEARIDRETSANPTRRATSRWHLAELNLGLFKAPLDSPEMSEFVNALDRINALADNAPGFVWRMTDDDGGPSSYVEVPGATDPNMASNLSVWESFDALRDYMYRTDHVSYLRRRADWFDHPPEPMTVAWWVPAGTIPTLDDALRRLQNLRDHGPSDEGWPLTKPRPEPSEPPEGTTVPEDASEQPVLIPYLTVGDARAAIDFYSEVFGAEQQGELFEMDDGRVGHAELSIRQQTVFLADDFPEMNLVHPDGHGGPTSMALVLNVDDCDAVFEHALAAGATTERAPADQHGFRIGWFVDPWGHRWSISGPETGTEN